MNDLEKQQLIISLIKDDLINNRLVNGLNALGINAGMYYLYLGQTVMRLMGIKDSLENEPLFEHYLELLKQSSYIDISNGHGPLDPVAENIYWELKAGLSWG